MERNLLLRSTAAFLLLFTAGITVFCCSQAHKTWSNLHADGGSHIRKESSAGLEIVLPPLSVLSSPGREDKTGSNTRVVSRTQDPIHDHKGEARNLSPPDAWPTSAGRAQFISARHSQVSSVLPQATSLVGKVSLDLRRSATHARPTTKIDTPQQYLSFATENFVKMVSSLTALFRSPSSSSGVQAPNFSDNTPTDPNANSLQFAGDGEQSRHGESFVRKTLPTQIRTITTTPNDDEVDSSGIVREQYKHRRALLRDISIPGMWPITSDDDDDDFSLHRSRALLFDDSTSSSSSATAPTTRGSQKRRRSLPQDISPARMWTITSDDDDAFQVHRRRSLLSSETASTSGRYRKQRRALLRDISPPGMWPITSYDDDEFEGARRRALLSHDSRQSSPNSAAATTSDRNQNQRRALLRDIYPPGMWPITSDAHDFLNARRRALLSDDSSDSNSVTSSTSDRHQDQKQRRALLRDISPPGMWPITSYDDEEFVAARRRALLSDDSRHSFPSTGFTTGKHPDHKQRRALLRDISPPGMWPITSDDDDEFSAHRRRALLSEDNDSTNSPSATSTISGQRQKYRRALLRDISPPGMWPITSDDDEFEVRR